MFLGGASAKDLRKGAKATSKPIPRPATSPRDAVSTPGASSTSSSTAAVPSAFSFVPSPAGSVSAEDAVIQAQLARQHRENVREQVKHALRIQTRYRSYLARVTLLRAHLSTLESKLADIAKVAALLRSRGVSFVPPSNVVLDLHKLLFACGRVEWALSFNAKKVPAGERGKDRLRIVQAFLRFSSVALIPSLSQADPEKNCAALLFDEKTIEAAAGVKASGVRTMRRLVWTFVEFLSPLNYSWIPSSAANGFIATKEDAQMLLQGVQLLLGSGPNKSNGLGKYVDLTNKVRITVLPTGLSVSAKPSNVASSAKAACSSASPNYHLFSHIRAILVEGTRALIENTQFEMTTSENRAVAAKKSIFVMIAPVLICDICTFLCEVDAQVAPERRRSFFLNVLTAPLALFYIPVSVLREAFVPKYQKSALLLQAILEHTKVVCDKTRARTAVSGSARGADNLPLEGTFLPPCPHEGLTSGQFLLGNVSSLGACLDVRGSHSSACNVAAMSISGSGVENSSIAPASSLPVPDALLETYLKVCLSLLSCFYVPGVFDGKGNGGVIWITDGAKRTTVFIPAPLHEQVLNLVNREWLSDLVYRVLLPFREDLQTFHGPPTKATMKAWKKQVEEVETVLQQDGLTVTSSGLERANREEETNNSWLSGRWASKMMSSVGKSLAKAVGLNSSSSSSATSAASAGGGAALVEDLLFLPDSTFPVPPLTLLFALTGLWSYIMPAAALHPGSPAATSIIILAFTTRAIDRLWVAALKYCELDNFEDSFQPRRGDLSPQSGPVSLLLTLASLMNTHLNALDDHEFYAQSKPLPLPHLVTAVKTYKKMLFKTIEFDATVEKDKGQSTTAVRDAHERIIGGSGHFGEHASRILGAVLTDLYTRWNRRPFAMPELWTVNTIENDITRYRTMMRAEGHMRGSLAHTLLHVMPWAWDLLERIKLFRDVIDAERTSIQQATNENGTLRNGSIICQIRRKYLLADGLKQLEGVSGANLKLRVQIQYVNEFGEKEAGIDIGGLFKDFVTDLSGLIFNPNYGLFCSTEGGLIYPNPQAKQLYEENELEKLYSFLGRVLGKALYENITIQPRFAPFFLNFMHSKYNFQNMVQDLRSLDPELYKNLMFLKSYTGDVGDLSLTFAVDDTSALGGSHSEVELLAGGAKVDVTSANRLKYINLVAKYYLHDRIKFQSGAFFHGLYQVISPTLLGMFGAPELQVLVSGGVRAISSDDLKTYAQYNGYFSGDAYMRRFWTVFEGLDAADKGRLVKFVTSCERPPILGFSDLQPPFTIQRVDCNDDSRLPTASTCFNILKLPTYSSQRVLHDKLLQAIRSESGFDLS